MPPGGDGGNRGRQISVSISSPLNIRREYTIESTITHAKKSDKEFGITYEKELYEKRGKRWFYVLEATFIDHGVEKHYKNEIDITEGVKNGVKPKDIRTVWMVTSKDGTIVYLSPDFDRNVEDYERKTGKKAKRRKDILGKYKIWDWIIGDEKERMKRRFKLALKGNILKEEINISPLLFVRLDCKTSTMTHMNYIYFSIDGLMVFLSINNTKVTRRDWAIYYKLILRKRRWRGPKRDPMANSIREMGRKSHLKGIRAIAPLFTKAISFGSGGRNKNTRDKNTSAFTKGLISEGKKRTSKAQGLWLNDNINDKSIKGKSRNNGIGPFKSISKEKIKSLIKKIGNGHSKNDKPTPQTYQSGKTSIKSSEGMRKQMTTGIKRGEKTHMAKVGREISNEIQERIKSITHAVSETIKASISNAFSLIENATKTDQFKWSILKLNKGELITEQTTAKQKSIVKIDHPNGLKKMKKELNPFTSSNDQKSGNTIKTIDYQRAFKQIEQMELVPLTPLPNFEMEKATIKEGWGGITLNPEAFMKFIWFKGIPTDYETEAFKLRRSYK